MKVVSYRWLVRVPDGREVVVYTMLASNALEIVAKHFKMPAAKGFYCILIGEVQQDKSGHKTVWFDPDPEFDAKLHVDHGVVHCDCCVTKKRGSDG